MREEIITVDGIKLIVRGEYHTGEWNIGIPDYFELDSIESVDKNIFDYSEWVAANSNNYLNIIEELVIEKISSI